MKKIPYEINDEPIIDIDCGATTGRFSNDSSRQETYETQSSESAFGASDGGATEAFHVQDADLSGKPFPVHCLPQAWRDLAVQSADLAQMPVQLPAMAILVTTSAAVGKSIIAINGSNYGDCRGNLYVIACAKSSTGKDVAGRLTKPFFKFERELQNAEDVGERPTPVLSISNATTEALANKMQNANETLFSFSPEAGDQIRVACGIYKHGKGEFAFYNGVWSGSYTQFSRISRNEVRLYSPCLSLCWFVQPNYFDEMSRNAEAMHSGFISRCLIFDAATRYALDDGISRKVSPELVEQWSDKIRKLLENRIEGDPEQPEQIRCTSDAREIFRKFHNMHQERRHQEEDIATMLGKVRENAIRIALVLAVLNEAKEIGTAEATGGCEIVDWCLNSTLRMMQEARMEALDEEADKLAGKLKSRDYDGKATIRDLCRRNGYEKRKIIQLIDRFSERFELKKTTGNGRPSEVVRLKS